MSRHGAIAVDHVVDSQMMLDDCRLQLPSDNVFRYCAQNGMPDVPTDAEVTINFRTAAEIEAERLAAKKAKKS